MRRPRSILGGRAKGAAKSGSARMASRMFPLLLLGVFLFAMQDPQYRAFYTTGAGWGRCCWCPGCTRACQRALFDDCSPVDRLEGTSLRRYGRGGPRKTAAESA